MRDRIAQATGPWYFLREEAGGSFMEHLLVAALAGVIFVLIILALRQFSIHHQ